MLKLTKENGFIKHNTLIFIILEMICKVNLWFFIIINLL